MPFICYVPKTFSAEHLEIIERANAVAQNLAAQGYDLSLRQCFYAFVSRGWLPNTVQSYKRLEIGRASCRERV